MGERIRSLDIAKGIGILLVVAGHAIVTPLRESDSKYRMAYDAIYFFHMAYFFFLSGVLMERSAAGKREDAGWKKEAVKKRAYQLMIPYLFYSIVGYCGVAVCTQIPKLKAIAGSVGFTARENLGIVLLEIATSENLIFHHLWFLYILFAVSLISIFVDRKHETVVLIIAGICHCWFSVMQQCPLVLLYLARYLFFFQLGRICSGKIPHRKNPVVLILFVVSEILYILRFANPQVNPGVGYTINRVFCAMLLMEGGWAGSLLTLRLAGYLEKCKPGKVFEHFGKNSMEIYLLHMPFLVTGTGQILYRLGCSGIVILGACTIVGIAVPLAVSRILKKNKWLSLLLFGRRIRNNG